MPPIWGMFAGYDVQTELDKIIALQHPLPEEITKNGISTLPLSLLVAIWGWTDDFPYQSCLLCSLATQHRLAQPLTTAEPGTTQATACSTVKTLPPARPSANEFAPIAMPVTRSAMLASSLTKWRIWNMSSGTRRRSLSSWSSSTETEESPETRPAGPKTQHLRRLLSLEWLVLLHL